jgi:hypothetical protein
MVGEDDHRHMVVPAPPKTQLVLVEADLAFALLEAGLDGPAHPAHSHQRRQRRVGRGVGQVGLEFRPLPGLGEGTAQHDPDLRARQPVAHRHGAQGGAVRHQRPPRPFQHPVTPPRRGGQLRGEGVDAQGRRAVGMTAAPNGRAPFAGRVVRREPRLGMCLSIHGCMCATTLWPTCTAGRGGGRREFRSHVVSPAGC